MYSRTGKNRVQVLPELVLLNVARGYPRDFRMSILYLGFLGGKPFVATFSIDTTTILQKAVLNRRRLAASFNPACSAYPPIVTIQVCFSLGEIFSYCGMHLGGLVFDSFCLSCLTFIPRG